MCPGYLQIRLIDNVPVFCLQTVPSHERPLLPLKLNLIIAPAEIDVVALK